MGIEILIFPGNSRPNLPSFLDKYLRDPGIVACVCLCLCTEDYCLY